ncbi:class C sortase [uncultured Ruminococcus sp.]|uniref:class C sortase n=1 Tax=uncultured Ruminococcus sp. TaxID=165186 RepID=UPI002635DE44|nr:class C sortase [uncultured Ruminococcus sp.]
MSKKRSVITNVIFVVMLITGLCLTLYPSFSNWWNSRLQSRAIARYDRAVADLSNSEKDNILRRAEAYNTALGALAEPFEDHDTVEGYSDILDITGTGIMGYITIPKIGVYLPIYHGTSPEVLNVAVGHLQGSSLPVGGTGCHAVISAHRGLPSARLFTDIDQLIEDDTFTITILDEVLTYEVDQIVTVLPYERNELRAVPEEDYVTLMTCTPYGINTHRLLVRAHRIDTVYPHNVKVPSDAVMVDDMTVYAFIATAVLIVLLIYWIVSGRLGSERHFSEETVYKIPLEGRKKRRKK